MPNENRARGERTLTTSGLARRAWDGGRSAAVGGVGAARAAASLMPELARIGAGRSEREPSKGDKRFADPAWQGNPLYRLTMQTYLAWCEAVEQAVGSLQPADWRQAERAQMVAKVVTAAAAPTNTFVGNPAALRRAFDTGGRSLWEGTVNLLEDLRKNRGMPAQVDGSCFEVGGNLAITPGAVVFRDEMFELLQYQPAAYDQPASQRQSKGTGQPKGTAKPKPVVRARPVLLVPPQINKYYFLDLAPGRSLVEYLVGNGLQPFMISWRNPTAEQRRWDLAHYVQACQRAFDAVRAITGVDDPNVMAFCAGGITATAWQAWQAATGGQAAHSLSYVVTLLDFDEPMMVGMFSARPLARVAKWYSGSKGVLAGSNLSNLFSWVRPNDLVFNYVVNNYLLGKQPPAFDILAWNADSTNLPAGLHHDFMDIFLDNRLATPNGVNLLGEDLDLGRITADTYVVGGGTDHLTPWRACYRTTGLLGGKSRFVLSDTGHIQTPVSPPGNAKSRYRTGPEPGGRPDEWLAASVEHQGTWWEDWREWILARSGDEVPAPKQLGDAEHPVLDPAPGVYVLQPA